jgi:hypothetical protein
MLYDSELEKMVLSMQPDASEMAFKGQVVPYLIDKWLDDYSRWKFSKDIVETTHSGFSYLFDIDQQRLISAWGISKGRHGGLRDASRMAGHPLSAGKHYHRGHAIPHTLGGPTDINLVPQLGKINIGPFRPLEKKAVATPGSMYFTYWLYSRTDDQKPTGVDQGLLIAGQSPLITRHGN